MKRIRSAAPRARVVVGAGSAAVALLIPSLPPSAAQQADRIDLVFWLVTTISIAIFYRADNRFPREVSPRGNY